MERIIITFIFPPIPCRNADWAAYEDGNEEAGAGYGATPEEALKDLMELQEVRNDR